MLSAISIPIPDINKQLKIIENVEDLEKKIKALETELKMMNNEKKNVLKRHLE